VSRQSEVLSWAVSTFGPIALDRRERAARLLEECIELAQAEGLSSELVSRIAERVYSRPAGDVKRELAQVAMTLDASAENLGLDAQAAAAGELERVKGIPAAHFVGRQAAKAALGIANLSMEDCGVALEAVESTEPARCLTTEPALTEEHGGARGCSDPT